MDGNEKNYRIDTVHNVGSVGEVSHANMEKQREV